MGKTSPKFFSPGPAADPFYVGIRDTERFPRHRELVEDLWAKFAPYCPDAHFLEEARCHFLERTWEMYLACVLLERGHTLVRPPSKGPDICVVDGNTRIWVEAVAVKVGDGADRVLPREARGRFRKTRSGITGWGGVPPSDDSLILRYMSALHTKQKKVRGYMTGGIVKSGEPCIVAVSFAQIEDAEQMCDTRFGVPGAIRSLFGIGPMYLRVPINSDEEATTGHHFQTAVVKKSGARIPIDRFGSDACAEISGVLCTSIGIVAAPKKIRHAGELVFCNPDGSKLRPGRFHEILWAAQRKSGLRRIKWHELRVLVRVDPDDGRGVASDRAVAAPSLDDPDDRTLRAPRAGAERRLHAPSVDGSLEAAEFGPPLGPIRYEERSELRKKWPRIGPSLKK